jgi:hypothetical protein
LPTGVNDLTTFTALMRALVVVVSMSLVACASGDGTDVTPLVPQPVLSDIQAKIFTPSCAAFSSCHNPGGQAAKCDLTVGRSWAELVNQPSHENPVHTLVIPGDPENSFLVKKLRGELGPDDGDPMPLRNPSLSEAQIQAIETWIAGGANPD